MSDDNVEVGDITIFDTSYFNQDYKLKPIWLGLLWFFIGAVPLSSYYVAMPGCIADAFNICVSVLTAGEAHAWAVAEYGIGAIFNGLGIFWLLAYIKKDNRIFQKIYYRAIAWAIPLSWIVALWILIAFIVGGTQVGGNIGFDLGYGFGLWAVLGGLEALAWYLAPGNVKFYKWDEQDWWNYSSEDAPDNWPAQLGDFVEY